MSLNTSGAGRQVGMYLPCNVLLKFVYRVIQLVQQALNEYLALAGQSSKGPVMKKSYAFALLLSAFAVSSFAQDASTLGARRVAERDAAYAKSHPVVAQQATPAAGHAKKRHGSTHRKHQVKAKKLVK